MSGTEVSSPTHADPGPARARRGGVLGQWLGDVLVVVVWFAIAGILGAVAWWRLAPQPLYTRTDGQVVMEQAELVRQVGIDGWFFVVAAVGGLVSGIALLAWRRRDPVLMVVLVVLGAGLASFLTVRLGHTLGPGSVADALRSKPDGATAPMRLELQASGMVWVWPFAAALGALIDLWVLRRPEE